MRDSNGDIQESSEETVLKLLKSKFSETDKKKIFSLCGNLLDCESIFSFKSFLKRLILIILTVDKIILSLFLTKRSSYLFNSTISGIDDSDLCVIVGSDLRKEAPIIGARLRKKSLDKDNNYPVIRIGYKYDLSINTIELGNSYSSILNLQKNMYKKLIPKAKNPYLLLDKVLYVHPRVKRYSIIYFHFITV